jgi:hypothetical protein
MNTRVVQLSSGHEVVVRDVPPTAYLDVELDFNRNHPPPKKPTIKAQSVAGHTEELLASMNSPEWAEYDNALELHKAELRAAQINFSYNYAVVKWRNVNLIKPIMEPGPQGPSDKGWRTEPPADWKPDDLCPDKTSPPRVLFIKYELINNRADERSVSDPFKTAPLSDEEVSAALDKFRFDKELKDATAKPAKRKGRGK